METIRNLCLAAACTWLAGTNFGFAANAWGAQDIATKGGADRGAKFTSSRRDKRDGNQQGEAQDKGKKKCKDKGAGDGDKDQEKHSKENDWRRVQGMDRRFNHEGDDDDDCECMKTSSSVLKAGATGASLQDSTTLLSAVSIVNPGRTAKRHVQVTSITLNDGNLISPAPLPVNLGKIPAGGSLVLDTDFSGGPFSPGSTHVLTVEGNYSVREKTYCFTLTMDLVLPPGAPGSAQVKKEMVPANNISGAPFPHQPLRFDNEVNPSRWVVPTAPLAPGTPTPTTTGAMPAPLGDPPAIVFNANNSLGLTSGSVNGTASTTAEPSGGATGGGVLFVTANWTAAFSTDGVTFTQLDPTTIFPNDAVGFCCDQIVQYVPSIDRFIWFLQGTGYRLASASPADIINSKGTAWTYWNLTPGLFGQPTGTGFDYPDLSVGNNELYMSWDAGSPCPTGCTSGFQVARTSLAGILAAGTITIEFTNPSDGTVAWGSHLTQDTGDEIFWAGHVNNGFCGLPLPFGLSLCGMRIFSLAEGSNTYFWRDVGISSWANNAPTSTTPDGQDWLAKNFNGPGGNSFPRNGVIGATRVFNQLWFAWTAGTDSNFQQPHVEMVTFDRNNNFNKIQQVQIWNNSYAFAYPSLATNACSGEVGLSLEYGGNGNYENHVVGFWGDYVVYITTGSNVGTTRFGDYVSIRQQPPTPVNPGNLFDAFGYGLNTVPPPGTGTQTDIHYVQFGRPASSCVTIGLGSGGPSVSRRDSR